MKIKVYYEVTLGVFLVSLGYYFFYLPSELVTGGINGIAIILEKYINSNILIYVFNIIFLIIGLLALGKQFFVKTCYGALLYPTFLSVFGLLNIDNNVIILNIGNQLLICAVMGSILTGIGMGLTLKNGGSTGGMDIPEKIISKLTFLPFSWIMYIVDGIIIIVGIVFFGIERAFFGLFAMILTGYFIDVVSTGGISKKAIYIITNKPLAIKESIYKHTRRGVTEIDVFGGYTTEKKKMLVCIMGINDYYKIKQIIESIDENAFMFVIKTNEVFGEGFGNG